MRPTNKTMPSSFTMKHPGKFFISLSSWEKFGMRAYFASTPTDIFLSWNASRHHRAQKENGILAPAVIPAPSAKGRTGKTILSIICLVVLAGCVATVSDQPTPEAARQFLKLRGYEFTEQAYFRAAAVSDVMAVNGFFSAGINANAKDENGDTTLTAAAARGDLKIVEALLRGGVDINARGRNNWTALLLALEGQHAQVADLLSSQPRIDLKAETPNGMTALMLAVWHQRPELVRKLLQLHSDPNHQDKDGDAALHGAAWYGNTRICRMLLDAGADPNIKNKLGGTALMWAASYGQDEVVKVLLERGADPRIKDVDGVTASGWAAKNGRANLVKLLQDAEK